MEGGLRMFFCERVSVFERRIVQGRQVDAFGEIAREVRVRVDQARHAREFMQVEDLGAFRQWRIGIENLGDALVLDDYEAAAQRLVGQAVDQCAAAYGKFARRLLLPAGGNE